MSLTGRDRKILIAIVVLAIVVGYWLLLLSPKKDEAARTKEQLSKQKTELGALQGKLTTLRAARTGFDQDYTTIVRLGKAIPTSTDMPSLLLQLQAAAKGTGVKFESLTVSDGPAGSAAPPAGSAAPKGAAPAQVPNAPAGAAAPGGAKAGTGLGRATESAGNTVNKANSKSAGDANAAQADTQTSTDARAGAIPLNGGGGAAGAAAGAAPASPGLAQVPLELDFKGKFFDMADFFHRLKRFVHVVNNRIAVTGRLITVDSMQFNTATFPNLNVTVSATAYLTPKDEGLAAGATPSGPSSGQSLPAASAPAPGKAPTTPPAVSTP